MNAAVADPEIRGILAVVGGDDQITVIPHLDAELVRDPKPFLGTSDNTGLHHWLWANGAAGRTAAGWTSVRVAGRNLASVLR